MEKTKVMIVDDHEQMRTLLAEIVEQDDSLTVAATAADGAESLPADLRDGTGCCAPGSDYAGDGRPDFAGAAAGRQRRQEMSEGLL